MSSPSQFLFQKVAKFETKIATEIKVLSEVEKLWILYDLDNNQSLEYKEIRQYIQDVTDPVMILEEDEIREIFQSIDTDNSGSVQRPELTEFIRFIMYKFTNIRFRNLEEVRKIRQDRLYVQHNEAEVNKAIHQEMMGKKVKNKQSDLWQ